MTQIVPETRAHCKQGKMPSYNDLGQFHHVKLPTETREEPEDIRGCGTLRSQKEVPAGCGSPLKRYGLRVGRIYLDVCLLYNGA
jgi:hypothetical protein